MARPSLLPTTILVMACGIGGMVGYASLPARSGGGGDVPAPVGKLPVAAGFVRRRPPQPGDNWVGCNAPRAIGTAPIYRGEPGYREEMDGDGDGIACEPIA
jgi:hypothetical protein